MTEPTVPAPEPELTDAEVSEQKAVRLAKRDRIVLEGDMPSATAPPSGCRFHTRCWLYQQIDSPERCRTEVADLRGVGAEHLSACHFAASTGDAVSRPAAAPATELLVVGEN